MVRLPCARIPMLAAAVLLLVSPTPGSSQVESRASDHPGYVGGPGSANYLQATRWAPYNIDALVYTTTVDPQWIPGGERFWYEWKTSAGTFYYIVDPVAGSRSQIFDNDRIAAELTRITRDPWDGQHLPIKDIRFIDSNTLRFDVTSSQDEEVEEVEGDTQEEEGGRRSRAKPKKKVHHFEYTVSTRALRELADYEGPDNHPGWASVSPDGNTVVFARNHNLFMMSAASYAQVLDARRGKSGAEADSADMKVEVEEIQLTTDGVENYGYAVGDRGDTDQEAAKKAGERKRAPIVWAKDSRRFAMVRADQREVDDLWVIHNTGNGRMELETYKYDMPGEENATQNEIVIYDLGSRTQVTVQDDPWEDQSMSVATDEVFRYDGSEEPRRSVWLSDGSDRMYFVRMSRDRHRIDLMVADAATGEVRAVVEERMNTYQETRPPRRLPNGDIVWWSERDGYAHLYLYGADGGLKRRLTEGPYSVQGIAGIDATAGLVYFVAAGREAGEDPYYQHLYRVGTNGAGLTLLTPGDFDHRVAMSESARFFVESFSRVNTVPASVLRDGQGRQIMELETADFSQLLAAGWRMPEPFTVKAADGVTDLYGVMYKPFDFDSTRVYPLVEYVYPGPQTESVSKFFNTNRYEVGLAQFGMIVITIGNRGGHPSRSKWYHNYGYGNLRDYGLADKKAAAEQLADRHDFIDIDRVGIYGHSGGGFMSTAAMLVYPDFFKVAVSSAGNHTNDVYNRWWSETHHGVKEVIKGDSVTFDYEIATNPQIAGNLKGHLLLTTGDEDNNVHPANTIRMAEALIKANKRFDFFLFPGQRHGFGNMSDYWFWLRAEYFVKHLLGDDRWEVDIAPLNLEREQSR
ncbi:MAG: S9 family peptidase [Gemmatimonadota bacterium]|nr:S9 family peptidase [Gemmatimonadota bacterium]MDH5760444.1 S9 family peptidase [Gemmatimonadota bacterium]